MREEDVLLLEEGAVQNVALQQNREVPREAVRAAVVLLFMKGVNESEILVGFVGLLPVVLNSNVDDHVHQRDHLHFEVHAKLLGVRVVELKLLLK